MCVGLARGGGQASFLGLRRRERRMSPPGALVMTSVFGPHQPSRQPFMGSLSLMMPHSQSSSIHLNQELRGGWVGLRLDPSLFPSSPGPARPPRNPLHTEQMPPRRAQNLVCESHREIRLGEGEGVGVDDIRCGLLHLPLLSSLSRLVSTHRSQGSVTPPQVTCPSYK